MKLLRDTSQLKCTNNSYPLLYSRVRMFGTKAKDLKDIDDETPDTAKAVKIEIWSIEI